MARKLTPTEKNRLKLEQYQFEHLLDNIDKFADTYGRNNTEKDLLDYFNNYAVEKEEDDDKMKNILYRYVCQDLDIKTLTKSPPDLSV